ncbi:MAG TPA: ATP-dependent zinc metalloprotease FtsH [Kiritimatiellia bacterium]|nr:ATP-dependent zinc metalloprotease FtsH [Kiritimatiellia bacterium]
MDPKPDNPQDPQGKRRPPMPMRALLAWFLLMALLITVYQLATQHAAKQTSLPYNPDFLNLLADGRINKAEVVMEVSGQHYIRGELKDLDPATGKPTTFRVEAPITENLVEKLTDAKVPFEFKPQNPLLWQILSSTVPFLLVFALIYFLFYRNMANGARGAFSFGKSRARLLNRDNNKITFKDVAGADEAREEVQEIIEFLRDPKKFQRLGGRIPKGVLLVGPPGTGKTLIAKAIAGEAQVPFFSISGSDFVEMFVGVGASRVRDMFEQGKKSAPCIIFIDEIDAVGRSRFSGIGGGHDEREQTLNALLVEMDGFDTQEGIIIIAATNRPDVLDPALLRPGRFDRQIVVDLPNLEGREAILKIHARKVKLDAAVELRNIARGTPGFSGADLANLMNEAALLAARRGAETITEKDLEEARDKVRWGRERRSRVLDDKEKRLTACHEAGHAIVLALTPETEPLHKVTIIPRGRALGATFQLPEKDRYTEGRKRLLGMITGAMGGRVAEQICFGEITTGAASDIKQATHLARMMVTEWGMSEVLGFQHFGTREELLFLGREVNRSNEMSEDTARKIDAEVKRILDECYQQALDLLTANRDKLDQLTNLLIERETLDGRDVDDILKHGRLRTAAERNAEETNREDAPADAPPAS